MSSPAAEQSTRLGRLLRECEILLDRREFDAAARLLSAVANEYDVSIQLRHDDLGHKLELL